MANRNSTQYDKIVNAPTTYAPLAPNELGGRVRAAFFSLNTTTVTVNNGDVVRLTRLPKGARVIGGNIAFGAMGVGATGEIGISGKTELFLASGTSVAAAGTAHLAAADTDDISQLGYETAAEVDVILTAGGANYAAAKNIRGVLFYVVD